MATLRLLDREVQELAIDLAGGLGTLDAIGSANLQRNDDDGGHRGECRDDRRDGL